MNVELPDGTIVEDVPDGISRAELATKLKANGMAVPSEWLGKRKVGVVETALRTAGEAARTAVGMFDMALAGAARGVDAINNLRTGRDDRFYQDAVLGARGDRQQSMRDTYAPKADEEFSGAGQVLGGAASIPIEVVGGMGMQHGIERSAEVLERGGTMRQAAQAGAVTGAVRMALNALPVKAGGAVGKAVESRLGGIVGGAATGGAIAGAGGMVGRTAENAALPEGEQFRDLQQDTGPDLVEIGMGAAFGALPGAAGKIKRKPKAEAPQPFPTDQMTDLGEGEFRAPNGATITPEAWENASPRVREGWMKTAEKVPVGEAKELDIKPEDIERQAELDRLKAEHPAGPVAEAVQAIEAKRAKEAEKTAAQAKARDQAAELRRAAGLTSDPEVQAELRRRADKLDPPEKIPTGKVIEGEPALPDETPKKPLPVGEATELPETPSDGRGPDLEPLPVGEATEVTRSGVEPAEPKIPAGEARELYVDPQRGTADGQRLHADDLQPETRAQEPQGTPEEAGAFQDAAGKEADEALTFPKIDETMISRMGEVLARQDYKPAEVPRVQATRALNGLVKKLDDGKINPDAFEWRVKALAERMTRAAETKAANRLMAERERGADIVREKLLAARRRGETDPDGVDLAMWAIDKNPAIAERLSVSVRASPEGVKALGDYNPASEIVRIFKDHANAQTAAHEIMHHTERMMPSAVREGIRKEWTKAYAKALAATKPGSVQRQVMQDFLPMMAGDAKARERVLKAFQGGILDKNTHYQLTNPSEFWAVNAARILHERFTGRGSWRAQARQWLKEMVEKVKGLVGLRSDAAVLKALGNVLDPAQNTGAKRSKHMLSEVDSAGSFKDIGPGPARAKLAEETAADEQARRWIDSLKPVERAQAAVAPKGEAADMRLAMKLAPGRIGERARQLEHDFIKPLGDALKAAKKSGLSVKDVDDYLTALHAPERNAEIAKRNPKMADGGSGLTNAQAQEILDGFTPEQRQRLDGVAKLVHGMNQRKLDQMVEDGLITPETRSRLGKYKNYVPLKTLDKEDEFHGVGRGFEMRPNDITSALGRTSRASSPVAASIMDATRAIARGERARVDKTIWEYAQAEEAKGLIREYHPNMPPKEVMRNALGKDGQVKQEVDPRKLQEHVVSLVVDGEQKRVFVPEATLAEALRTAGDPQRVGDWLQMYGTLTRAFSRTLTEWNPAFAPVNVVKDTITGAIRAKRLGLGAAAVVKGVPGAMRDIVQFKRGKGGDLYREMKAVGGAQGAYGLTRFGDTLGKLEKMGADLGYDKHKGGTGRKFSTALGWLGDVLSHFNEIFEYSVRLSAYRDAKAKGMTPAKAAAAARDITLDFNVNGEIGRRLGHVYSFFNAAIQGITNDVKDLRDKRTRLRMLSLMGLGAAVRAVNEIYGGVDEDTGEKNVNKQHDSVLDDNITVLPLWLKIPLPPGLPAALFAIGNRLAAMAFGGDVEKNAAAAVKAVVKASVPVRIGDGGDTISNVLSAAVPNIPAPFYMLETNRDNLGRPIVPEQHGKATAPYHTTSRSTTSSIAKSASKGLNTLTGGDDVTPGKAQDYLGKYTSPEAIEFLVGYYTGGVGQFAMQSKNLATNAAEGKPQAVDKIPVLKRFIVTEPQGAADRRYKELSDDFERAKKYQKLGQDEKIKPAILNALPEYLGAEKELTALFKQWREATDTTERERIGAEIKQVQSRVIKAFNQSKETTK